MSDADALLAGQRAGLRYSLGVPRRAPVGAAGQALAFRAGSSLEFKDHREYEPGDDLRHIDWNAYARTDQLTVKVFREEANPHLDLLLDRSRSMALAGSGKRQAALGLAALLATAAGNAGFSRTVWSLADSCQPIVNGDSEPAAWQGLAFDYRGNPQESLAAGLPRWRPRGVRILLSDLLWLGDPITLLAPFAERAGLALVVQVLARADAEPPVGESVRLIDSETDDVLELVVDAAAGQRYRDALARHQDHWQRACRQVGALFTTVVAETLVQDWRLDDLVAAEVLAV
jgi:uncharacterized protein (DUF58 family)